MNNVLEQLSSVLAQLMERKKKSSGRKKADEEGVFADYFDTEGENHTTLLMPYL